MDIKKFIKLGDRIKIKIGSNWYGTIVERLGNETTFFISPPLSKNMRIKLDAGRTFAIKVTGSSGVYEFDAKALETDMSENIPIIKLLVTTEPTRYQRRKAYRIEAMVDIVVREAAVDENGKDTVIEYRTKTLNLSESGMIFISKKNYIPGTMLECDMTLNISGEIEIIEEVRARVIRFKPPELDGVMYQTGVAFEELSAQKRRTLVRYVMMRQRTDKTR